MKPVALYLTESLQSLSVGYSLLFDRSTVLLNGLIVGKGRMVWDPPEALPLPLADDRGLDSGDFEGARQG
ncbi:MAG: hypothetical protein AB4040_00900 [Synechococcus sp.]